MSRTEAETHMFNVVCGQMPEFYEGNMKKLSLQEVLHLNDKPVRIHHKELGAWDDIVDGIYTLFDLNRLYLEKADIWLDCDEYGKVWIVYSEEKDDDAGGDGRQ